jgi:hypothetical protein
MASPERIHSVVRDTRIVYLVREPVERIVSRYIGCMFLRPRAQADRSVLGLARLYVTGRALTL